MTYRIRFKGTDYPKAALMARNALNVQTRMERGFAFESAHFDRVLCQYALRRLWGEAIDGGIHVC